MCGEILDAYTFLMLHIPTDPLFPARMPRRAGQPHCCSRSILGAVNYDYFKGDRVRKNWFVLAEEQPVMAQMVLPRQCVTGTLRRLNKPSILDPRPLPIRACVEC